MQESDTAARRDILVLSGHRERLTQSCVNGQQGVLSSDSMLGEKFTWIVKICMFLITITALELQVLGA